MFIVLLADVWSLARGDLIRSSPSRSFPDIAGDIVGAQTYTYDPVTQTGMFQVVNAPHLISLGPSAKDMVQMLPEQDGTLTQSLQMKLDRNGRLVNSPDNKFEIRGTVVIGDQTYQGLLLEGNADRVRGGGSRRLAGQEQEPRSVRPEHEDHRRASCKRRSAARPTCGSRPRPGSTFNGQFTADFSSEKPLTNLRAIAQGLARRRPRADGPAHTPDLRRGRAGLPAAPPLRPRPLAARRCLKAISAACDARPHDCVDLAGQSACIDADSLPSASFSIWRTRSRVSPSDSPISLSVLGGASLSPNRIRKTVASRLSISSRRSRTSRRLSASTIITSGARVRSSMSISPRLQPFSGWSVCGTRL